ncbi:MAG: protoporphyrinogen oxidase [Terriglobales bacterium]
MKRIAIIGGGISGLSAAFALEKQRRAGVSVEYLLYEANSRPGGVILSERVDGCLVEAGPDSFLTEKPWAADLCRELGIGDQLVGSNDSQRRTYILVHGKLIPIPDGLVFMVPTKVLPIALSPLFSFSTKLRMAREWFNPPCRAQGDESVASFVERHYGNEMVERVADPLLSGIYGGEALNLSLQAVLPRFAGMEGSHGSLARAISANHRHEVDKIPRPLFTTLKEGMQQLVNAIGLQLPAACIRFNAPVQSLRCAESRWIVAASNTSEQFDAVIAAVSAHAAAKLLDFSIPAIASELRGIPYSSSVTVSLGYDDDEKNRASLPAGFGFLVPRSEGKRILAVTFVHNKFANRAPERRAIIRCFLGGTRDEPVLDLGEDEILRIVRKELRDILHIDAEPMFSRVYKWKAAMAQYNVGHLERLQRIEQLRMRTPGLFLAGNAYNGIGVPDCLRSGTQAAMDALSAMKEPISVA